MRLAERLGDVDPELKRRHALDRSISCKVSDLSAAFSGELRDGSLHDVVPEARSEAQIRFTVSSDDLVALTDGRLNFASAWASGRLKIDASVFDLLRLRSLL